MAAVPVVAGGAVAGSGVIRSSWSTVAAADVRLEAVAGLGFMVALVASACTWRLAFRAVGSRIDRTAACASYAAGSLVNTLCPARVGDGVRAALFARGLPDHHGRTRFAAGAVGAIALARALAHVFLIGGCVAAGVLPLWPLATAGGAVVLLAAAGVVLRPRRARRLAPLFDATVALVRRPRAGATLVCWSLLAVGGRVAAAAAVASSIGVPRPLQSSLAIAGAVALSGIAPVTPGGIGITTGAISLALVAHGVGSAAAVGAGLVFQGVETLTSVVFAGAALLWAYPFRGFPSPAQTSWAMVWKAMAAGER